MAKLKFSILKYIPDLLREEDLNIGLIAQHGAELYERHLSSAKIRAIDPKANPDFIESSIKIIFEIVRSKGDLEDEMLEKFQRNVRISRPVEIEFSDSDDPRLVLDSVYVRVIEAKKEQVPLPDFAFKEAGNLMGDPALRARVVSGEIAEARAEVERRRGREIPAEGYLTLLALSNDEADWIAARDEVVAGSIHEPRLLLLLGFRFWSVGKVESAIHITELGLDRMLERVPHNMNAILRLKNNLAYYYAELRRPEDEEKARQYSREARMGRTDPNPIDTEGYVLITFGKNAEEILAGVKLCEEARRAGSSFELYHKHITRAYERLKELAAT